MPSRRRRGSRFHGRPRRSCLDERRGNRAGPVAALGWSLIDEDQVYTGEEHQTDEKRRGKSRQIVAGRGRQNPRRCRNSCRRGCGDLHRDWVRDDVGRESIPVLRDGFDPSGRPGAECLSQLRDLEREVGLLDEGAGPERRHQLLFRERAPRTADQQQQEVEGLRRQLDALVLPRQDALTCVQATRPELEEVVRGVGHRNTAQEFIRKRFDGTRCPQKTRS
jgi:hypothetical protein